MNHCVNQYKYSIRDLHLRLQDTPLLDADLRDLQNWRCRGAQSIQKLRTLTDFTKYWSKKKAEPEQRNEAWDLMIRDLQYLTEKVEAYSGHLEAVSPVVMSLVQILESGRSFAEAANTKQPTYVALVFVPLSFVATLFSMSERFAPGRSGLWMYFAMAVPLSLFVLTIARFPLADMGGALSRFPAEWSRHVSRPTRPKIGFQTTCHEV
jgi:Mg2+ and Co2+ transporter CorA